jgi:Uncharacterized conserved protein (DUF2190)
VLWPDGYALDYAPAYWPGERVTLTAYGPLTAGDPVDVTGPGIVTRHQAGGSWLGIAASDAADGDPVPVETGLVIHDGPARGTITAGGTVTTAPPPAQVQAGTPAIGLAITSAADGHAVRWAQL